MEEDKEEEDIVREAEYLLRHGKENYMDDAKSKMIDLFSDRLSDGSLVDVWFSKDLENEIDLITVQFGFVTLTIPVDIYLEFVEALQIAKDNYIDYDNDRGE